jgi:hypothetical protein
LRVVSKSSMLTRLANLNVPNIQNWVNRLDDVADADLLRKIDNIITNDPAKLAKLNQLYDPVYFKLPADRPVINGLKSGGDFTVTKTIDGQQVRIYYDRNGFPDFAPHSPGIEYCVKSENLVGKHPNPGPNNLHPDNALANNKLIDDLGVENVVVLHATGSPIKIKINGKWEGPFTWHHYQDGKTMMPVKQGVHGSSHTGGAEIVEQGLKEIFNSLF